MSQLDYLNPNLELLKNDIRTAKNRIARFDHFLIFSTFVFIVFTAVYQVFKSYYSLDYQLNEIYIPAELQDFSISSQDPFSSIADEFLGILDGTMGKLIAGMFVISGLIVGAARQSLLGFAVGIGAAIGIANLGPILKATSPASTSESIQTILTSERTPQEISSLLSDSSLQKISVDFVVAQLILKRYYSSDNNNPESIRRVLTPYHQKITQGIPLDENNAQSLLAIEHFVKSKLITDTYQKYANQRIQILESAQTYFNAFKSIAILLAIISSVLLLYRFKLSSIIKQANVRFGDQLHHSPKQDPNPSSQYANIEKALRSYFSE